MTSTINRLEDGSIQLQITIPQEKVKKAREEVLETVQQNANLPGFRKGKAPAKLIEDSVDEMRVKEDILKRLLADTYVAAVGEHNLRPIMNPKIHVDSMEDTTDWVYTAVTCEMPQVDLGDYKKKVQDLTAKGKIVVPGQEEKQVAFEEIVKLLLETVKVQVPEILLEQETDRLLAQTLNEIKALGLSLDQYLASTGKNVDALREEYKERAKQDVTLEFTLQKIAETEKITVEPKEIEEALQKAKDDNERASLEANKYLLTSILRQQKTLDFLKSL